jgi:hypothetical protein
MEHMIAMRISSIYNKREKDSVGNQGKKELHYHSQKQQDEKWRS